LLNKYIVSKIKSGLVVVDQNRAHERILYEDFLKKFTLNSPISQQLLFPLELKFTVKDLNIIKDFQSQLTQVGFDFEQFTKDTFSLSAVPLGINESFLPNIFDQLICDIQNEVPNFSFSQSDLLAKSIAKSLAKKNGNILSLKEQEFIVNSLFACKEPTLSPSNKKIFITIEFTDLDSKFN